VGILPVCVGLAALGEPRARAQVEIDPDHLEFVQSSVLRKAKINASTDLVKRPQFIVSQVNI
jgi:hypothetical protein